MAQLFPEKCSQKFCFNQGNVWQSQLEERISITDSKEEKKSGVLSAYSSLGAAPSPGSCPDEAKAANTEHSSSTLAQIDQDRCSSWRGERACWMGGDGTCRAAMKDQIQVEKKSQKAGEKGRTKTGQKKSTRKQGEKRMQPILNSPTWNMHICLALIIIIIIILYLKKMSTT